MLAIRSLCRYGQWTVNAIPRQRIGTGDAAMLESRSMTFRLLLLRRIR